MAPAKPVFARETFQFFKDLARHNRKEWMDANRERYQTAMVQPFRRFLEEMAPAVLELDSRFDTSGRTGPNFSRINRDIRFAKDKTLQNAYVLEVFRSRAGQARNGAALRRNLKGHSYRRLSHLFRRETQRVDDCADRGTSRDR